MRLQGKVAIVTGGGAGFGEGIARRFAAEGAKIVVNDIDGQQGERVAREITDGGGEAAFINANVASGGDMEKLVAGTLERHGRLDVMVNNAGVPQRNGPLTEVSEEAFDRIYAVNVKSIYWAAIHCVPVFRRQGGGVFINTSSTAAIRPRPGLVWYNGSKGAVNNITKSMAVELAPDKIRVNAICPVAGETQMLADFMGGDTPEKRAAFRAVVPLGRFSQPLDIANAALFLASDEAEFLTGVCLEVDGGRCV